MARKPHHSGTYDRRARRVRAAANADPATICWYCRRTLDQHAPHADGSRPRWTAGHTIDGYRDAPAWLHVTEAPPPGPWLAPEASTCNYGHHDRPRNPQSRAWLTT